jgi:hypothetical protein
MYSTSPPFSTTYATQAAVATAAKAARKDKNYATSPDEGNRDAADGDAAYRKARTQGPSKLRAR